MIELLKTGVITFGRYPTTAEGDVRWIDWRVLKVEGDKALAVSEFALDCKQFGENGNDVTWENSLLRRWLNNEFLAAAFCEDEREKIIDTFLKVEEKPVYDAFFDVTIDPGRDTVDKVFLLSVNEARTLFESDEARLCRPTAYAKMRGVETCEGDEYQPDENPQCEWWLRSSGVVPNGRCSPVATVSNDGGVLPSGVYCDWELGVRPAMWIRVGE